MDDSNIYYYLVFGAIYVISRFLKKKKPEAEPVEFEESSDDPVQSKPKSRPSSIEDILKELTKEMAPTAYEKPIPEEVIKPVEVKQPEMPDYQEVNIEAVGPDEKIDIVPHKQIERKKPLYKRALTFEVKEEENEVASGIRDFLNQEDGPQKAIIMKEIFDRKY